MCGRMLTSILQIGAAQVSFVNPPVLKIDFTGAANVADFSAIDGVVRNTLLGIINSYVPMAETTRIPGFCDSEASESSSSVLVQY
jgi:hypothetical protein